MSILVVKGFPAATRSFWTFRARRGEIITAKVEGVPSFTPSTSFASNGSRPHATSAGASNAFGRLVDHDRMPRAPRFQTASFMTALGDPEARTIFALTSLPW